MATMAIDRAPRWCYSELAGKIDNFGVIMTTFVLVHGAYHGGWCWKHTAPLLQSAGHDVFTPTLTGLGERSHLASAAVNLDTHIRDIVNLYDFEDLDDTVLVGHSYGGVVVSGVADQMPDRIKALIYLDAIVPRDGATVLDYQTSERRRQFEQLIEEGKGAPLPAPPSSFYGVTDPAEQKWADDKCVPHPVGCFLQQSRLTGAGAAIARHAYIRCTDTELDYMEQFVEAAQTAPGWDLHYLETGHDCMITEPEALAALLLTYV